jgi:hypothetical protein
VPKCHGSGKLFKTLINCSKIKEEEEGKIPVLRGGTNVHLLGSPSLTAGQVSHPG